jgi:hypothetical protein
MIKVAEELDISDVALKKICDKHRVPTPPRGFWAKRAAGKPTKQIGLHNTADPQAELIVIQGSRNNLAPSILDVLDAEREHRRASKPDVSLVQTSLPIPIPISDLHSSLLATAKVLRACKPDFRGLVHACDERHCGVAVSATNVERAILILTLLVTAIEQRGF